MTYITEYLENEAGIQNNGVTILNDQKIELQVSGLVIGQFKRGRFDKPMTITSANVRGTLGHDPRNPWYKIVVDAIDAGVPSIEVLRIPGNYYNYEDVEPEPEPIWQSWQIDQEVSINSNMVRYTASKTNGKQFASSYAEIDLIAALVRSFADIDMQQWQAVKNAANQLTGVDDWVLDPANNSIIYTKPNQCLQNGSDCPSNRYLYKLDGVIYSNQSDPCNLVLTQSQKKQYKAVEWPAANQPQSLCRYQTSSGSYTTLGGLSVEVINNPAYDPSATEENQPKSLPLETVAQKVISSAESLDQGISLLAETYIKTVAKSIFSSDQSKQFVKQDDLVSQFEENKVIENL